MMGYAGLILLSIATLLVIGEQQQVSGQPSTKPLYFGELCVTTQGNYSANSTYESNRKMVVSDLEEHASSEIFYNSSAGSGPNTVYGQYFCRGDVNSTMCGACIHQAAHILLTNCTLVKGGIIWFQQCTLRYSNASMVGIEAEYPRAWYNATTNVGDPDKLASVLDSTINRLIEKATEGTKPSLFATGEAELSAFETLYCLIQCSPDLNATQCDTCLRSTYTFIPSCCVGMAKQVAIFYASCQLRYTTLGAFYSGAITPPRLPPSTTLPLPPPPPPHGTSSGASIELRSSTAATIVMAAVPWLTFLGTA